MGKYLYMVKAFEARRQTEGRTAPQQGVASSSLPEQTERTVYGELVDATPPSKALEVFPDWSALLVKSIVLGFSVWVVRNHIDGIALAKETGHPALILDDVLKMKGRTAEEARAALLPALITLEQ